MTTFLIKGKPNRFNSSRWIDPILRKMKASSFTVAITPQVPGTSIHFVVENRKSGLRARLSKKKLQVHLVLESLELLDADSPSLLPVWVIDRDAVVPIDQSLTQALESHLLRVTPYYTDTQARRPLKPYPDAQGGVYGGKVIAAIRADAGLTIHLESGYVHTVNSSTLPQPMQWLLARNPDQFLFASEWDARTHYKES